MQVTLPISKSAVQLRDFIPHKVVLAFNEAMFKGVQISSAVMNPTKEEMLAEFGADVMRQADELDEPAHSKRLAELREQYVGRKMEMKGMTLGNAQEANLLRVVGMVQTINGAASTREAIEELPHDDVLFLLAEIEKISEMQEAKKALPQHGN